jgi:predicted acylesterase/phospholipase RssA/CRP-like cAMP-binding protein
MAELSTGFTSVADIVHRLRSAPGFSLLAEPVLRDLAADMCVVSLGDGDALTRQGDRVRALSVVVSGTLKVDHADRRGATHQLPGVAPGATIGEIILLSDAPAMATVSARGPVVLVQLAIDAFERFAARNPAGALAVVEAFRPQLHRHALRVTLRQRDPFRDLDPQLLLDLESELEPVALYAGETLLRRGDSATSVYLVLNGRVRITSPAADGSERLIAEAGPGETIGEISLITGQPHSADLLAVRDTQLARLTRPAVERLLSHHPMPMLGMLARSPLARLQRPSSGRSAVAPATTIAVVPAARDVPLARCTEQLAAALASLGGTRVLTSGVVDAALGRAGAAQAFDRDGGSARLVEWLAEQELEHRFVLYQSDADCSPWTERSIRQADHVVIVADAAGDPAPGEIETHVLSGRDLQHARLTLVLVHASDSPPRLTARWLDGRRLERHLHVRAHEPRDFERVARLLTGNAVGLVLGGGFARGLANVGVLRAMRELGMPIDAIGGSSMGAMVAALYVIGWDLERIVNDVSAGLAQSFDDMTIPFLALKRGGKSSRLIHRSLGHVAIEDLRLPYFCTSANLNRIELKIHSSGPLARAVVATTRAAGVFPPVVLDGELHVDGGLINNVPVDVMRAFCNYGTVVGVDVSPPHELNRVVDYGQDVPGWRAMWHRFNPAAAKRSYRPSILLIVMRLIEFGGISYRLQTSKHADVFITPDLLRFKRNDFQAAAEIVQIGYSAARDALGQWLERRAR